MRRTQIYLEEYQDEALELRADSAATTKSELIRDAIDAYLGIAATEGEALARFRGAVADAAGVATHLPSGADYVDELRKSDRRRETALDRRRAARSRT